MILSQWHATRLYFIFLVIHNFSWHNLWTPWRWCINTETCCSNIDINFTLLICAYVGIIININQMTVFKMLWSDHLEFMCDKMHHLRSWWSFQLIMLMVSPCFILYNWVEASRADWKLHNSMWWYSALSSHCWRVFSSTRDGKCYNSFYISLFAQPQSMSLWFSNRSNCCLGNDMQRGYFNSIWLDGTHIISSDGVSGVCHLSHPWQCIVDNLGNYFECSWYFVKVVCVAPLDPCSLSMPK
jgi:hypothetical protein